MKKISVLLADDHTVVRQGLRSLLTAEPDITVVGEAEDGHLAVRTSRALHPDIVVMDLAMPRLSGLEATRQIVRENPRARVLILSSYCEDEYVQQFTAAGACGYLTKQTAAVDLIRAIREAEKGNAFFSPSISRRLLNYYRGCADDRGTQRRGSEHLTSREMEVLQLVAEGNCNKEIAATLGISVKTVEKHRQKLMDKLNIHETAGLTRYAISHGVVKINPLGTHLSDPLEESDVEPQVAS